MRPDTWPRIRSLFEGALELEPERREDYLVRECAADLELLADVRGLLSADAGQAPVTPLVDGAPGAACLERNLVGSTIGGFHVVRRIGAGGMGTVYEARQERPQRTVALKTLAVQLSTERSRRRFEDEAEILARLRHPAIAQVVAAGTARSGDVEVPWFAMELVEEPRPIDRFVREAELDVRAIVAAFVTVCDAVHYAHQHGVIHRDLKPANVLVDRHGQAKLIDFGIARLADRDALTRFTRTGEILGTLAYMSPERLERAGQGDDTPADIYALGVILYELLAGRAPFALAELPPMRVMEVLRAADPPPPSRVHARVPAELDWVTLKAMAREPGRRYASVAELGHDLERYLRGEPLAAGPPSAAYRLRKLAWRHRLLLGATAAAFAALSIGLVVAVRGWSRVAAAERIAQRRADVLAEVNRFQLDVLRGAYGTEMGGDIRLADVIDRSAAALDDKRLTDPIVEIGARTSIGVSYLGLGRLQDAEQQLLRARALLDEHGLRASEGWGIHVSNTLSLVYQNQGLNELAEREMRRSLADRLAFHGPDHLDVAIGRNNLAVLLVLREACAEALELATLAQATFDGVQGESSEASINARALVARALSGMGRDAEAEQVWEKVRDLAERHLHPDHPARLSVLAARANFLHKLGRVPEAARALEAIVAAHERVNGPQHPLTLRTGGSLAGAQLDSGRQAEAEATARRVVKGWQAIGVRGGYDYVSCRVTLTQALRLQGRAAEAEQLSCSQRRVAMHSLSEGHWLLGVVTKEHGVCLRALGRLEEAEAALLEAHALLARATGPGDYRTRNVVKELIALYEAWPRPQDSEAWRDRLPPATK